MQPYSLNHLYRSFSAVTGHVALYLPRTSDLGQIAAYVGRAEVGQIVHYCTHADSRALCAYLGSWREIQLEL